jgi:signal peptidase I
MAMAVAGVWLSGARLFAFPGESMVPTVNAGDYFVGFVGLWRHRTPERFEMVIFDLPPTSKWAERKIPWMKRLVGLPGEHVRLSGAELFINGRKVESTCLHAERAPGGKTEFEIQLGQDEFCVLGDNLDHSFDDSRSFGPLSRNLMRGWVGWVIHRSGSKTTNQVSTAATGPVPAPL